MHKCHGDAEKDHLKNVLMQWWFVSWLFFLPPHAGCSQTCQLTARVAGATATIILVVGLLSCLVLFGEYKVQVPQHCSRCRAFKVTLDHFLSLPYFPSWNYKPSWNTCGDESLVESSTRGGSDLQDVRKGSDGAAAAVPTRAPWSEPDAPNCHSGWFRFSPLIRTSCECESSRPLGIHFSTLCLLLCADPRCSVCPGGWLWWRGRCYFFSVGLQENRQWNESAEFCQQHNSSLAVIKDSAEMVTFIHL